MSANFETETSRMNADLKNIKHQLASCRTDLGWLAMDILSLRTMWKGQASNAYFATMINDKEQIEAMLDKYSKGIEKLSVTGFSYEKTEKELEDKINSIRI